jgi:ppGpp synthetase/RelA/SpoT-type nucleotidyltranferase
LVESQEIDYISVSARTKTLDSFLAKAAQDKYTDPSREIFDIVAARIVTYVESDIQRVVDTIERSFQVFREHSPDKSAELGVDRAGYRSVHLVCEFGNARCQLPEFEQYGGVKFEIQIRTALQHAWAEIEHDRQYKVAGILPSHLRRRLYILAGVLELADREFDGLVKEIDSYARDVARKTEKGELDIELNSTSVAEFVPEHLRMSGFPELREGSPDSVALGIEELRNFGVTTLAAVKDLLSPPVLQQLGAEPDDQTLVGLFRSAMMLQDLERYLEKSWQEHWGVIHSDSAELLFEKYGRERVISLLESHGIGILDLTEKRAEIPAPRSVHLTIAKRQPPSS